MRRGLPASPHLTGRVLFTPALIASLCHPRRKTAFFRVVQTPTAEFAEDAGFAGDRCAALEVRRAGDEGRLEYRFGGSTTDEYSVLVERLAESREARTGSDLLTLRAPAEIAWGEFAAVFQEIHDTGWYVARLETLD